MTDPKPIIGPEGLSAPPAIAQQVSAIEKKGDEAIAGLRREIAIIESKQAETIASIRHEMAANWIAHQRQHSQEQDAIEKAVVAMDKRLDGLNELRQMVSDREKYMASLAALDETNKRIDRDAIDTRLRFEAMDRRLNEQATQLSKEARMEGRPGQDLKTSQAAIVAAIALLATILGILAFALR